jgi:hypothetical protein
MKTAHLSTFFVSIAFSTLLFAGQAAPGSLVPMAEGAYESAVERLVASQRDRIESYVAPASLSPVEGYWSNPGKPPSEREQEKPPYHPIAVFSRPDGPVIGLISMTKPQCVVEGERPQNCEGAGQVVLTLNNGSQALLPVISWSEGTFGLITLKPSKVERKRSWSEITYPNGSFWVRTDSSEVHPAELLAAVVVAPAVWCLAPGHCSPVTPAMKEEMRALAQHTESTMGAVYEISERVTHKGVAYYRVALVPLLPGAPKHHLPTTGYVPTRDEEGKHTGSFSPYGC